MDRSDTIGALSAALAKAQATFAPVQKTKTAKIPTKSGSSYSYRYADLGDVWAMCRQPLADNGLSVVQAPENGGDGSIGIVTMLCHDSGEWVSSFLSIRANDTTAQAIGAAITYLRRYGLCAMLGIVSDDDVDAQHEQEQQADRKPASAVPPATDSKPTVKQLQAGIRIYWQEERKLGGMTPTEEIMAINSASYDGLIELGKAAKKRVKALQAAEDLL